VADALGVTNTGMELPTFLQDVILLHRNTLVRDRVVRPRSSAKAYSANI
jgi:hypothetical protein